MSELNGTRVVVTDIQMPFLSIVVFLVKLAIASIPAMIILGTIGFFVTVFFGIVGGVTSA